MRPGVIFKLTMVLLAAALLLSGCAGTARGAKKSVYQHDATLAAIDRSRSQADAMVVIRYPAVVHQDAQTAYFRQFELNAIGGRTDPIKLNYQDSERIAQSIIAKSNFFVMSLFRELQSKLPEKSVLLSPHMVVLTDEGRLSSRPLLASEEIPSVVSIDFSVYSFPDPRKMMDSPPLTFGDIVTPMFVIHSNRWLRPSTHGLLLSSEALVPAAWRQSEQQADEQMSRRLQDELYLFQRPLDFIEYLDRGTEAVGDLPLKSAGESRREVIAVEVHPPEKIRMDSIFMEQMELGPGVDPFAEDFVKGAATRVVTALNRVNHDRATFFSRQMALSRFDQELGLGFLSRSGSEELRARLHMGETLLKAERKFLAAQSARLFEGVYEGVYGDQMRQMIAAEYRMLEQRRELARQQNMSTALAIVAMAGAAYVGSNMDSGNILGSSTMENLLLLSSIWAVNSAFALHAESKTVGENFLVQMAPAINRQVSVQVEWLESTEEITARDFTEFREKTMALYQRSVRSMQRNFEPACTFGHPQFPIQGRWFGRCEGGQGAYSGYGLLIDGQGNSVEYLGEAVNGMAAGNGAMIIRYAAERGAIYYEGAFKDGLPDGIVRVEEPGRKAVVRTFRAGKNVGSADADQWQRLQF